MNLGTITANGSHDSDIEDDNTLSGLKNLVRLWQLDQELLDSSSPLLTVVLAGADLDIVQQVYQLNPRALSFRRELSHVIKYCPNEPVVSFLASKTPYNLDMIVSLHRQQSPEGQRRIPTNLIRILAENYQRGKYMNHDLGGNGGDVLDNTTAEVLAFALPKLQQVSVNRSVGTINACLYLLQHCLQQDSHLMTAKMMLPRTILDLEEHQNTDTEHDNTQSSWAKHGGLRSLFLGVRDGPRLFATSLASSLPKLPLLVELRIAFLHGGVANMIPTLCQILTDRKHYCRLERLSVNYCSFADSEGFRNEEDFQAVPPVQDGYETLLQAMQVNTSLTELIIGAIAANKVKCYQEQMTQILQEHNASLARVCLRTDSLETYKQVLESRDSYKRPIATKLVYWTKLNHHGRGRVRNNHGGNPCHVRDYMQLLHEARDHRATAPYLTREERDTMACNETMIQYGLLRENPALWSVPSNSNMKQRLQNAHPTKEVDSF